MKLLNTILSSLVAITLMATPVYATESPVVTAPPAVVEPACPDGALSWEQGRESMNALAVNDGGVFVTLIPPRDDGSFGAVYKFPADKVPDPTKPFFILAFDKDGCYLTAYFMSEQEIKDQFGVVISELN